MKAFFHRQLATNSLPARFFLAGKLLLLYFLVFMAAFGNILLLSNSHAAQVIVNPGEGNLQTAISIARDGDKLILRKGYYKGNINIDRSLSIQGQKGTIIEGDKDNHVIRIDAPDVLLSKLGVRGSGNDYSFEHSGIFITDKGDRSRIEHIELEDNLIGIYLKGPEDAIIENNSIIGSQLHRMNDRGNAIHLWNSPGSKVINNTMRHGRDGIYVTSSSNNVFDGNRMQDLRFAIHYMYTHDSVVSNNISKSNHVGFALMYSHRIKARNNHSINDRERGLFFNFANYSEMSHNQVTGGNKKCVFIYNSNYNELHHNFFEDCGIGIHFTAGSEKNIIYQNAFINNRTQVKYVGTRYIEWSKDGVGNYWSDNSAFDIDGNGIADQAYRPNGLVDQIIWRHPLAKLLINSPAVQLVKWAQSVFPGLYPGGVTDSAPMMVPPPRNNVTARHGSDSSVAGQDHNA